MTSGISFSKLVRSEWRQLGWLTAVQTLVFCLAIPFLLLINLQEDGNRQQVLYRSVGFDKSWMITFLIVMAGILCALCVFEYLHVQVKLDFYNSLAVRKEMLFFVKFTAGAGTFAAAYLISQILAALVGALYGVMSGTVVQEMAASFVLELLFFLISYAAAAAAMMLTGKILTSVLAVAAIVGYGPLLWIVIAGCIDTFYPTLYTRDPWFLKKNVLEFSSPWALVLTWRPISDTVRQGLTGMWPDISSICLFAVLPAVLLLLALALCRVRRTEAAGRALAFGWTEGLIKVLLAFPAALLAGMLSYETFRSPVWGVGFIALFGVLACAIMEFIYRWDIRQIFVHWQHMVLTIAAASILFLAARFDVTGVNTWLPAQEELAAMAICNPYDGYLYFDEEGNQMSDSAGILRLLETENTALLYPLAEDGIQSYRESIASGSAAWVGKTSVEMEYRLRSGRTICRRYEVDQKLYREAMEQLLSDADYCRRYYPILSWDEQVMENIGLTYIEMPETEYADLSSADSMSAEAEVSGAMVFESLSSQDGRRLIEAYREDLAENPCSPLDFDAIGWLRIEWKRGVYGYYVVDKYPIMEDFTRTQELLRGILE